MKQHEAAALLAVCASFDNRKPDEDMALSWAELLADLPYQDCKDAIFKHYRESREWLMPVDIVTKVQSVRTARLASLEDIQPPDEINNIEDHDEHDRVYRAWLRETRDRAAAGEPVEQPPRSEPGKPTPELQAAMDRMREDEAKAIEARKELAHD